MATSFLITSWLRAFFAMQESASDGRDVIEIPDGDEDKIRWPRTTVADVQAIVELLDPFVRTQPFRFGGHGLGRRWRSSIDALAQLAPDAEYPDNRTFWRALPAMCLYLHSNAVPLPPPAAWTALLARLRASAQDLHDKPSETYVDYALRLTR
jgi:hypothetical protein